MHLFPVLNFADTNTSKLKILFSRIAILTIKYKLIKIF
ncbi:hypothetical protein CSUNSWCD_1877 [Campylobacter showae CSUNSWCD]|uniref:Uncharacterized protein n=1 Tax=Campylobacter showae CSUNSWCD TaxID=1244083 RepID=M5IQI7_9BACT|nr:hypothetical protein CSUNSWCD_1877 [Campylobacter showae CSUNSWCD]